MTIRNDRALSASYQECRTYTKDHAKAFFFASYALPRAKRFAAYSVYAFCRRADDLVDETVPQAGAAGARRGIEALRNELDRMYRGMPAGREEFPALYETVRAFDIPKEHFLDLLRGVEMDLDRTRYATFKELREYCYCVASVVGLIMTKILGTTDDAALDAAADLGTAMQLTNILRDVGEDRRMGRVYLPQEDLARFRYPESDLASGVIDRNFVELMRFQIARARAFYRRSEAGIPLLADPGARRTVRIMGRAYRRILDEIEKNRYDVFTRRAFVSFPEKLLIAAGSIRPGPGEEIQQGMREGDPVIGDDPDLLGGVGSA